MKRRRLFGRPLRLAMSMLWKATSRIVTYCYVQMNESLTASANFLSADAIIQIVHLALYRTWSRTVARAPPLLKVVVSLRLRTAYDQG